MSKNLEEFTATDVRELNQHVNLVGASLLNVVSMFRGWQNYGTISQQDSEERSPPQDWSTEEAHDFPSRSARFSALACILLCQFFSWVAFNAIMLWIPVIATSKEGDNAIDSSDITYAVLDLTAVISGVAMDAWIRKTSVLISGVIIASAGIIGITVFTFIKKEDAENYFGVLFAMLMVITAMEAFNSVALPTLGGDQFLKHTDVRPFYASFYWCRKAGEAISCGLYIYISDAYKHETRLKEIWPIMILIAAFFSIVAAVMVSCCRWVRQADPHCTAITNPFKIVRQSCRRKNEREDEDSFFSVAKLSKGGDFPDEQVDGITKLFKFAVVLLCLVPGAFSLNILSLQKSCYEPTSPAFNAIFSNISEHTIYNSTVNPYSAPKSMLQPLIVILSALIAIPVIHFFGVWLAKRGYYLTILHRFALGHIVMIGGNIAAAIYVDYQSCTIESLFVPSILNGVCKALIYTTGYELTLISAPRSMQGTAIGLFYFMDGLGTLTYMAVLQINTSAFKTLADVLIFGGVVAPLLGLILLIFMENKFRLGLRTR